MSKRVWLLPVLAAALVAMGSGAAFAIPSLGGPTGVVSTPNALVAPVGEVQAAVSWQQMQDTLAVYGNDVDVWSVAVLGGVANGAELWAAYSTVDDVLDTSAWGVGAKLQFAREPEETASLAIGGSWQKAQGDARIPGALGMYDIVDVDADLMKLYVVGTKDFTPAGLTTEWSAGTRILGTAGMMWMKLDEDDTINGVRFSTSPDQFEPFFSVQFIGTGGTSLGVEWRKDGDLDTDAVFSAVLSHQFGTGIVGEIGTTNASPLGLGEDDQNFFARVGYTFPVGGL